MVLKGINVRAMIVRIPNPLIVKLQNQVVQYISSFKYSNTLQIKIT